MKLEMKRQHEKILVAILAGMIMVGAAAFAVQPAIAKLPPQHAIVLKHLP
jgi:hypothetical protein